MTTALTIFTAVVVVAVWVIVIASAYDERRCRRREQALDNHLQLESALRNIVREELSRTKPVTTAVITYTAADIGTVNEALIAAATRARVFI